VRVLVTGVGGFLGSHVLNQLIHGEHDVIGVDSLNHNGDSLRVAEATTCLADDAKFLWMCHDLTAPFSQAQLERIGDLDAIIHTASLSSVDASIRDPTGFVRNNVNSTLTMLELARHSLPYKFIHMSTDEVYGASAPCADGHHMPSSPYAASKAAQEDLCNAWRVTFHVPTTIVRSANMFGERQSELAFIPRIVRAVAEDTPVTIHIDRDGKPGIRNYTYVGNVASYLINCVMSGDHVTDNVTLRGQVTSDNVSVALNVAKILGRELQIEYVNAELVRPGYDKKYELHGDDWNPQVGASDALRRTVLDTARRMGLDV
jgi:dTDP-glucose 4,6-dehydratase